MNANCIYLIDVYKALLHYIQHPDYFAYKITRPNVQPKPIGCW